MVARFARLTLSACLLVSAAIADDPKPAEDITKDPTLYTVGYAHLDTQWRWTYPQVIREYIPKTLHDNFALMDKYPFYIFNFSGSRRYEMMREYYPADYEKLKAYVKRGQWFPCGSSVDEGDVNVPSAESLIRHVLYGNRFFRSEFGKESVEFMLPDCFGFPACLPSVLAHCGIKGFSTQKLVWGSAVGIPFNVGVWEGLDGTGIVAALNCTAYVGEIKEDLSRSQLWLDRIKKNAAESGLFIDYRYYGTGDTGGAPKDGSVDWVGKSVASDGPVRVLSAVADQMFRDLTPDQIARMPRFKGDLLLTEHSAGSLTSAAYMKRWNRQNEVLADAAERASVIAQWAGGAAYPSKRLYDAWSLVLGSQMHDILPGTSHPRGYEYSQNDEVLAGNQFADILETALGAIADGMDTGAKGVPIVVFNALGIERADIVEARIGPGRYESVRVFAPDGSEVPAQLIAADEKESRVAFLAKVPSVGVAVYDVQVAAESPMPRATSQLSATKNAIENEFFRVTLNDAGDVASILDKSTGREVLSAPIRLAFQYERPANWPSWNMDWNDQKNPPRGYVDGPAKIEVAENGPARVALRIERDAEGSHFVQFVRLSAGDAGKRIEFVNTIDWQSRECCLKAVFPLAAANPKARYNWEVGTIERANNDPKKYEVPARQWIDLADHDGKFGATVLTDCKYGSDKPDDNTLRLTLIYSPGTRGEYQDQGWQDWGRHEITFGLAPHHGDYRADQTDWQAYRLNQPLIALNTPAHAGSLGKTQSFASISNPRVRIYSVKQAEEGREVIVRLIELSGQSQHDVHVKFARGIESAREVDGQEREIGSAKVVDGALVTDIEPYRLRTFALKLVDPGTRLQKSRWLRIPLQYERNVTSRDGEPCTAGCDSKHRAIPAEMLPTEISYRDIKFELATTAGKPNAVVCRGQPISLPRGNINRVYLLLAADGDRVAKFDVDGAPLETMIYDWTGFVGEWDTRIWKGEVAEQAFDWPNKLDYIRPGFVRRAPVAWFCSHHHDASGANALYQYCYLYACAIDVPKGAQLLGLPNDDHIFVVAATGAFDPSVGTSAAAPLFDELNRGELGSPRIEPAGGSFSDPVTVTIHAPLFGSDDSLHYTLDGSEPTLDSPAYSAPFSINKPTTVRTKIAFSGRADSPTVTAKFDVNDTTSPSIVRATASTVIPKVALEFSEPLDKASAETIANYKLAGDVPIVSAAMTDDGRTVNLTLGAVPAGNARPSLTVSGVRDRSPAGNAMKSTTREMDWVQPILRVETASFDGDGKDSLEERLPQGAPIGATAPWSINFWFYSDDKVPPFALLGGFGDAKDIGATQRYLCSFPKGLHFWGSGIDINTGVALEIGKWQMLTATFDGTMLRVYKDGQELRSAEVRFNNAEGVAKLSPPKPWPNANAFKGKIARFTIWNHALPAEAVAALREVGPE